MKTMDYIKANRSGSRQAVLEYSTGWTAKNKLHASKKQYKRKPKHNESN